MEKAWEVKDVGLQSILVDQHWDNLRDNERFKKLLRNIGYTTDWPVSEPKTAENPEVAKLCKLSRFYYYKITDDGYTNGMECLNKALEIDPNSVEAYACIADLCVVGGGSQFLPYKKAEEKMRWAKGRLVAIDPRRAEGHAVEGFIKLVYDWNPIEAEKELMLALQLDPDLLLAHIWHGRYFLYTGKFEDAEREFKRAQQLDPTRYGLNVFVGLPSFFSGNYDRAIEYFEHAIGPAESQGWGGIMVGRANEEKGDFPAAIEAYRKSDLATRAKPEVVQQKYKERQDAFEKSGGNGDCCDGRRRRCAQCCCR